MQGHVKGLIGLFVYQGGGLFVRLLCNFPGLKRILHLTTVEDGIDDSINFVISWIHSDFKLRGATL